MRKYIHFDKERITHMKKLLSVLLTVVMVSALFAGLVAVKADGVTVSNHNIDSKGYHPDRTIYTIHGWSVTDTKIKKIGYVLDSTGDPCWLIDDVSDVERVGNVAYTQGVDAFNEAFLDSALHDAIVSNSLSNGLTDFYAYRIHVVLDTRDFAVNEQHNFTVVAQFENGDVKNVFRDWTVDLMHKQTIDTFVGDTHYRQTLTTLKNISVEQTEYNELVITSNSTANDDHYLCVNLPNVDTSVYTSVSIKYKFESGSTAAANQTYFKASKTYTAYGATAGTWASPRYIEDGNWHVVTYYFENPGYALNQNHPYAMKNKILTGIRINCAATNGTMRIAYISFDNKTAETKANIFHTSTDQVRNSNNAALTVGGAHDRSSTTVTDYGAFAGTPYINVYGWVADAMKLYGTDSDFCFGYQYGNEEPVFDSTRFRGGDDATIVAQAPGLGLSNGESVRFNINVPVREGSDLSFYLLAKMEDGTIKRMWQIYYTNLPAIELSVAAFSGVTVNGTSVASGSPAAIGATLASSPIIVKGGVDAVISAAGSAQVQNGFINKFAYRIDSGALVETSRFIDDSKTVPLKNNGYIDDTHDAKGFYKFNVNTSALAAGDHVLKLYATASDLSGSGDTAFELVEIPFKVVDFKFSAVNVSLAPGAVTDINFKINKAELEGASEVSVKFLFNGEETVAVDSSEATDTVAVYKFSGISPEQIADEVTATITATYGETQLTYTKTYSVKQYCMDALGDAPAANTLNTLLVDLLRYGAAAQTYANYNINDLADKDLTAAQLAVGTDVNADLNLTQISNKITAITSGEKKVKWTTVHLKLEGNVAIVLKLNKLEGKTFENDLTVKYTIDDGTQVYEATMLDQTTARINMPVNMMKSVIHAAVYDGDTVVSSTVNYSIESYAAAKQNETTDSLGELVKAMMRFGNAAAAYQPAA